MDVVHKARQVGKDEAFYAQKLDAFTLTEEANFFVDAVLNVYTPVLRSASPQRIWKEV